jgi:DegV family protein with EDD domain
MAHQYGITLLDSYIVFGDSSSPESLCRPQQVYMKLREGAKITTAQASTFERHQYYKSICEQHGPALYLCVGAAFTGNYNTAMAWKSANGINEEFTVIDTGAASGRLALIALLTARYAEAQVEANEIIAFASKAIRECEEYVFINELKYLVAGGRLAKSSGFLWRLASHEAGNQPHKRRS